MKTINKTIIMALAALVLCMTSTYADWFGIGSITDDDDLPEVYHDHDYDGRGVAPDMTGDPAGLNEKIQQAQEADKKANDALKAKEDMIKITDERLQYQLDTNRRYAQDADKRQVQKLNNWESRVKDATKKGLNGTSKILPSTRAATGGKARQGDHVNSADAIIGFSKILNAGVGSVVTPYNIVNEKNKLLDMPLTVGMESFSNVLYSFRRTVLVLCELFCVINIIIQAFKLWFGAQEIKKVYVDVIWKTVCCMLIIAMYPTIVDGVMSIASGMGENIGNGYHELNNCYTSAIAELYKQTNDGVAAVRQVLDEAKVRTDDGKTVISEDVFNKLTGVMSESELKTVMQSAGIDATVRIGMGETPKDSEGNSGKGAIYIYTYYDKNGNASTKKADAWDNNIPGSWYNMVLSKSMSTNVSGIKRSEADLKKYTAKLHALAQVMSGEPLAEGLENNTEAAKSDTIRQMQDQKKAQYEARGYKVIKNASGMYIAVKLMPFLRNSKDKYTTILSPSDIMTMCLNFTDALTLSEAYDTEQIAEKSTSKEDPSKNDEVAYISEGNLFWSGLRRAVMNILVLLGMTFSVIVVMIEYTITIVEYYIVTSLGALLIPLMFLDATKEYTKGLLRLFLQFYLKMLVQILAIFFTMSMYIQISVFTFSQNDASLEMLLGTYLGVLAVGLFICCGAGKLAGTLLSGQPSASAADMVHAVRHGIHAARMGASLAEGATIGHKNQRTGQREGGILGGIRGGVHGVQNMNAIGQGRAAAKQAGIGNFDKNATKGGAGYTTAAGEHLSGETLEGMKNGTLDTAKYGTAEQQKARYAALKEEAGERSAKGFTQHAVGQWFKNAAYKKAMGEEKITDDQNVRFTGIGSQTAEENGKQQRTANAADMRNVAKQAGTVWGGGKSPEGKNGRNLDFFQPPPKASPITFGSERNASMEPGYGDRKDGGTGI